MLSILCTTLGPNFDPVKLNLQHSSSKKDISGFSRTRVNTFLARAQSELLGSVNVCRRCPQFSLSDNSSYTTEPILTKLHRNVS